MTLLFFRLMYAIFPTVFRRMRKQEFNRAKRIWYNKLHDLLVEALPAERVVQQLRNELLPPDELHALYEQRLPSYEPPSPRTDPVQPVLGIRQRHTQRLAEQETTRTPSLRKPPMQAEPNWLNAGQSTQRRIRAMEGE